MVARKNALPFGLSGHIKAERSLTVNIDMNSELMDELRKEKEREYQLERELEFYKVELNKARMEIKRLNQIINNK